MSRTMYKPLAYRPGSTIIREEYTELLTVKGGFQGTATYIDFIDSKGNIKKHYMLRIKWH